MTFVKLSSVLCVVMRLTINCVLNYVLYAFGLIIVCFCFKVDFNVED